MRKIPTLFARLNQPPHSVGPIVTPGCEWVLEGEGFPLRKYDGTCVMKDEEGNWWARRTVKKFAEPPVNFVPVAGEVAESGGQIGWVPIEQSSFERDFKLALDASPTPHEGTYELCGPKINGNPEGLQWPGLVFHAHAQRLDRLKLPKSDPDEEAESDAPPRDFAGLREWLLGHNFEGIVWWHPDGRRAKLKRKDFA